MRPPQNLGVGFSVCSHFQIRIIQQYRVHMNEIAVNRPKDRDILLLVSSVARKRAGPWYPSFPQVEEQAPTQEQAEEAPAPAAEETSTTVEPPAVEAPAPPEEEPRSATAEDPVAEPSKGSQQHTQSSQQHGDVTAEEIRTFRTSLASRRFPAMTEMSDEEVSVRRARSPCDGPAPAVQSVLCPPHRLPPSSDRAGAWRPCPARFPLTAKPFTAPSSPPSQRLALPSARRVGRILDRDATSLPQRPLVSPPPPADTQRHRATWGAAQQEERKRQPFSPCNPHKARKEVARAPHECYLSLGVEYECTHNQFLADKAGHRMLSPLNISAPCAFQWKTTPFSQATDDGKNLSGAFFPNSASQARTSVAVDYFLFSGDEASKVLEKQETQRRSLVNSQKLRQRYEKAVRKSMNMNNSH